MKVIIAGSRDITSTLPVIRAIVESGFEITELVCGMARGVDTIGYQWAQKSGIPIKEFLPDWGRYGKRAGLVRNDDMASYAEALICVHKGTSGSLHMCSRARQRGLKVFEVEI